LFYFIGSPFPPRCACSSAQVHTSLPPPKRLLFFEIRRWAPSPLTNVMLFFPFVPELPRYNVTFSTDLCFPPPRVSIPFLKRVRPPPLYLWRLVLSARFLYPPERLFHAFFSPLGEQLIPLSKTNLFQISPTQDRNSSPSSALREFFARFLFSFFFSFEPYTGFFVCINEFRPGVFSVPPPRRLPAGKSFAFCWTSDPSLAFPSGQQFFSVLFLFLAEIVAPRSLLIAMRSDLLVGYLLVCLPLCTRIFFFLAQ